MAWSWWLVDLLRPLDGSQAPEELEAAGELPEELEVAELEVGACRVGVWARSWRRRSRRS